MKEDPDDENFFLSAPQLLVTRPEDDQVSGVGDIKADDEVNDNTHLCNCSGPVVVEIEFDGKIQEIVLNTKLEYVAHPEEAILIRDQDNDLAYSKVQDFKDFYSLNVTPHFRQVNINLLVPYTVKLGEAMDDALYDKISPRKGVGKWPDNYPDMPVEEFDGKGLWIEKSVDTLDIIEPLVELYGTLDENDIQILMFTKIRTIGVGFRPNQSGITYVPKNFAFALVKEEGARLGKYPGMVFVGKERTAFSEDRYKLELAHELAHTLGNLDHVLFDEKHFLQNILYVSPLLKEPSGINPPKDPFYYSWRFNYFQEKTARPVQQHVLIR